MKIILLRHGPVDMPAWPWITASRLVGWIEAYNSAGIRNMAPPASALDLAAQCNVIVTSDLLRSVASGRVLSSGQRMLTDRLFREVGLPYGAIPFFKLPPPAWALSFRLLWAFGFQANGESISAFRKRTRHAAERLISLAHEHDSVLLAGHGLINRYIAHALLSAGWHGSGKTKIRHWGSTIYTHET
jgi:broad specificity phosphatase PhoE